MNHTITPHCDGIGCQIKDKCKRNEYFRKTGNSGIKRYDINNSFISHPFKINKGKFECDMFVGNGYDIFLEEIKSIINNSGFHTKEKKK